MKSFFFSNVVNSVSFGLIKWGWYSLPSQTSSSPIVLGGCSRSGTTLLYAILNSHPRIFIAHETALFTGNRDLVHISGRTGLPLTHVREQYRKSPNSAVFTERLLIKLMINNGKVRWGDKSPVNVANLSQIFHSFPNARFVHLIRDGRDAVCSLHTHAPGFKKKETRSDDEKIAWDVCVERWNSWVRTGIAWRHDSRYYEVKYEDLVQKPEQTVRDLLQWLGEPWDAKIFEQARLTDVDSHPGIKKPINRSKLGRWKSDLPEEARQYFLGPAQDLLLKLGYTNDEDWLISGQDVE